MGSPHDNPTPEQREAALASMQCRCGQHIKSPVDGKWRFVLGGEATLVPRCEEEQGA